MPELHEAARVSTPQNTHSSGGVMMSGSGGKKNRILENCQSAKSTCHAIGTRGNARNSYLSSFMRSVEGNQKSNQKQGTMKPKSIKEIEKEIDKLPKFLFDQRIQAKCIKKYSFMGKWKKGQDYKVYYRAPDILLRYSDFQIMSESTIVHLSWDEFFKHFEVLTEDFEGIEKIDFIYENKRYGKETRQ